MWYHVDFLNISSAVFNETLSVSRTGKGHRHTAELGPGSPLQGDGAWTPSLSFHECISFSVNVDGCKILCRTLGQSTMRAVALLFLDLLLVSEKEFLRFPHPLYKKHGP